MLLFHVFKVIKFLNSVDACKVVSNVIDFPTSFQNTICLSLLFLVQLVRHFKDMLYSVSHSRECLISNWGLTPHAFFDTVVTKKSFEHICVVHHRR